MKSSQCTYFKPPFKYTALNSTVIGTNETKRRFAEVTYEECGRCDNLWLYYFYEIEAYEKSGRRYRGIIDREHLNKIYAENAIKYLKSLDWHFLVEVISALKE